jgi:hypothetical protein
MKEFIIDLWSAMLKPDLSMTAIDAPIISALKSKKERKKETKKERKKERNFILNSSPI